MQSEEEFESNNPENYNPEEDNVDTQKEFSKQVNSAAWFMLWVGLGIAAIGAIGLLIIRYS